MLDRRLSTSRPGGRRHGAARWVLLGTLMLVATMLAPPAGADAGYLTPQAPFLTLDASVPAGSTVKAIINSGDQLGDFVFEGLPDGIGIKPSDDGHDDSDHDSDHDEDGERVNAVDVYVSHEQTTIPFRNSADFQNATVSKLTLSTEPGPMMGAVLSAEVAIPSSAGFLRFCSAFMAGPAEGFSEYTFFANEEANDIVDVPVGATYGPDPALGGQRQAGYAVALRTDDDEFRQIDGLGRLNHENTIALPGYSRIVLLTTDDTFSGPSAQLYMYLANDEDGVWKDRGSLWAFRVTRTEDGKVKRNDPFNGANDYLDLEPGEVFSGEFIRVPKKVARGDLKNLGPQDGLEAWSNDKNVFQFIRLEDLAYDKNDPNKVYIADTGRSRVVPDPATGRLMRGPGGTVGQADNGRVFVMEFNEKNPRKVDRFYVLAQGDALSADAFVPFVSPDNMDTSVNSLMVQEDADNAKIWRMDLASGVWSVVATVNDPDGESSGIVDASEWFGEGAWLLDVQAHGTNQKEELQPNGVLLKREDGQLLLMKIPGS